MKQHTYKRTDLAYLAGIIDGEGSISFLKDFSKTYREHTKRGFGWRGGVNVSNTDIFLFKWIKEKFGKYGIFNSYLDERTGLKRKHRWTLRANDTRKFLPKVLPYLILKRERAELTLRALELLKEHHGGRTSNTKNDKKLNIIYLKMKKLNQKGNK